MPSDRHQINRIDPPGFYQKADTNLHCFSKDGQHVALAIDETLELERSIARWCNSTASHAPIAKGEIISSSVLEPTLESHGHVVHYQSQSGLILRVSGTDILQLQMTFATSP